MTIDVPETTQRAAQVDGPRKMLVLHIAVPAFNGDDLDELAGYYSEPDPPSADDRLTLVTEEWMRADALIVLTSIPGEKCMNSDFEVRALDARIIGAELQERSKHVG